MSRSDGYIEANVERFMGFADCYDRHRPRAPEVLLDLLTQLAGTARPGLVVDLGSGTGLSTLAWSPRAGQVVGIEPSGDMRAQAEARLAVAPEIANVSFRGGYSHETGFPDDSAAIVTCSQSLHWMEPAATFAEAARILRPGGVFAAYDSDWPPTIHWEAEAAYHRFVQRTDALFKQHGLSPELRAWAKSEHLDRMRSSGRFRYTREIVCHHVEEGDAERLVGVAISQGTVASLLKHGLTEADLDVEAFRAEARRTIGDTPAPWYWSYRARIGIV